MDQNTAFSKEYRIPISDVETWKKFLEENGYVVVTSVLSKSECEKYLAEMWRILEVMSEGKVSSKDKSTWTLSKNYPYMLHGGMIQYIGHAQFQWDLREKCADLFAKVWGVKETDLATSFDGWCFMNGERKYMKRVFNSFLHTDQSPHKDKLWSYQGVMNLNDCDDTSGGFVCIPKTHLTHRNFLSTNFDISDKRFQGDWILFSDEEKSKFEKILGEGNCLKLNCKAGDFILWDSRTFHCNTVPTKSVIRANTYVCMIPKKNVPNETKEKRKKALLQKRCCSHHPGDGFRMFPKYPRFGNTPKRYQELIEEVQKDLKMTDLMKSLAYTD
jgi:ectoine hydroxylase-related dioxygenase (phytanoyl-CoA dioxygenase family)